MKRTVIDIKKLIETKNCRVIGDVKRELCSVQPIHKAMAGDSTFYVKKGEKAISLLEETKANVVICDVDVLSQNVMYDDKTLVAVNRPRLRFLCFDNGESEEES